MLFFDILSKHVTQQIFRILGSDQQDQDPNDIRSLLTSVLENPWLFSSLFHSAHFVVNRRKNSNRRCDAIYYLYQEHSNSPAPHLGRALDPRSITKGIPVCKALLTTVSGSPTRRQLLDCQAKGASYSVHQIHG